MTVQITSNYLGSAQQLVLRSGQVARIGRSEWVELSILDDASLEEQHFAIDYRQSVLLTCKDGAIVHRNGTPTSESTLEDGDQLLAGQTEFQITIPDEAKASASTTSVSAAPLAAQHQPSGTWRNIDFAGLQIDQAVELNIVACESPQAAISMLVDSEQYLTCVRFIACILDRATCARWTLTCIDAPKPEQPGHTEIAAWLVEPTEANRLQVAKQMRSDVASPADWLMQAIAWMGGSLGDAKFEPIPPPAHLPPLGCSIAIQLCVAEGTNQSFFDCIELARELIDQAYPARDANLGD